MTSGTVTTWTELGTAVPTLTEKSTLLTRGALPPRSTVSRILVRCSVVKETDDFRGLLPGAFTTLALALTTFVLALTALVSFASSLRSPCRS